MNKVKDIAGATINLVSAGFVLGTTKTYTTTVSTEQVINGKFGTTLAAQTNTAIPTTDATTGVAFPAVAYDNAVCLVFGVNAAGAIKLSQGPITPIAPGVTTTVGAFLNPPPFPELPDDFCPIAYGFVRVAPTAVSFTTGTTNWTASGVTCTTFQNVATLPDRPQIA